MLRWRAAPSKHPPRTHCLKPATLVLRGSLRSHLRMRVAALRPLRGNFFGNLMMVRVAAMCRPSLAQACRAATPTALMLRWLWPKDKASKHPPRTPALSPQPSSFEAPVGHLRMRVALLQPAAQRTQLAPAFRTRHPAAPSPNPIAIKNPGHRLRKLRRSRGSTCPWYDLQSVSITIRGHGYSDGAL